MKKLLFFAAATAVALSSCSKNEVFETPDALKSEIQLSTYVGTTTKATAVESASFEKFALYAYNGTADTYIADSEVERTTSTGECTLDKSYYWPTTGSLDFFAFYPLESNTNLTYSVPTYDSSTITAYPSIRYTASTTMADQVDLLVVTPVSQASSTSTTVALPFTHALTQISFAAKGDNDAFDYYVTSIKINDVYSSNTYTWTAAGGAWSTTVAADTGLDTQTAYTYMTSTDGVKVAGTATASYDAATGSSIAGTSGTLMLLPQVKTDMEIEVAYYVTAANTTTPVIDDYTTSTKTIAVPADWTAGSSIVYTLGLTNSVKAITVTASISSTWPTVTTPTQVTPVTE